MPKLVFIVIFLCSLNASAQGWRQRFYLPGALNNTAKAVFETTPGNYISGGIIVEKINGITSNRLCVMGLDGLGQMQWVKKYGNSKFEYLDNPAITRWFYKQGNNLYYTGSVKDSTNKIVGVLIKLDLNGDTIWQKTFSDQTDDFIPQRVIGSIDGGFLITGFYQNWTNHTSPCLLLKTDGSGNELWRKKINKGVPNVLSGRAIVQDSASKRIVIGGAQHIGNSSSWLVCDLIVVLDSVGTLQTMRNYISGGPLHDLIQTQDKKIVAVGHKYYAPGPSWDLVKSFAYKLDLADMSALTWWLNEFDKPSIVNYFTCITELPDGNLMVGGAIDTVFDNNMARNEYARLTLLNTNGLVLRNQYYNYKYNEEFNFTNGRLLNLAPTADGGLIGSYEFINVSPNPYFIIKYDGNGCDSSLAYCQQIAAGIDTHIDKNTEFTAFPNPCVNNITFNGVSNERLILNIYNASGTIVFSGFMTGQLELSMVNYASGIYFYSIMTKDRFVIYTDKFLKE